MHDVQQIQRAAIVLQPEDDLLFSVNLYIITKNKAILVGTVQSQVVY